MGYGNNSCGKWLAERKKYDQRAAGEIVVWITAYLSGLNVGLPQNETHSGQIGDRLDNDGVIEWMDNYCDQHPLETIQVASNKLYEGALLTSQNDKTGGLQQLSAGQSALDNLQQQLAAKTTVGDQLQQQLTQSQTETDEQRRLRAESELQIEMLNAQLLSLRQQLARLVSALDASEAKAKADEAQVIDLGKRLNESLANKVEELARYRSEFFGNLREVLGDRPDIQVVGDRFIFQSEVLFDTGSAEIGEEGKKQLAAFADTLKTIAVRIPPEINWVLRVDGHTDKRPYHGSYGTNWELSTARAIAVVKFMIDQYIPANRLVAAGYAEFQPLDDGDTDDAYRRNRRIELKLDQR